MTRMLKILNQFLESLDIKPFFDSNKDSLNKTSKNPQYNKNEKTYL